MGAFARFLFALCGWMTFIDVTLSQEFQPTESNYPHQMFLDFNKKVKLYWRVEKPNITFELHVKTTGWIGLGLSTNGAMKNADIVVGWSSDGKSKILDMHGPSYGNGLPELDDQQNIESLMAKDYGQITMMKFRRNLVTCDKQDMAITDDTIRLLYAYGASDPVGSSLTWQNYHYNNRGSKSAILLSQMVAPPSLATERKYNFTILNNATITSTGDTYYNCRLLKFPQFDTKQHIIKIEPVIDEAYRMNVHHIIISTCTGHIDTSFQGKNVPCFETDNYPQCYHTLIGWAVGGGQLYFPSDVGFPLGVPDAPNYVVIETHYDNTLGIELEDKSGLRFIYTPDVRKHDAGALALGHSTNGYQMIIPPQVDHFTVYGHCTGGCLSAGMDAANVNEIKIFSAFPHTHLAGRKIKLSQIRNGTELQTIIQDDNYDFDYQEYRAIAKPKVIKKGDSLLTKCTYSTLTRPHVTLGGLKTSDEMCLVFSLYYPKIPLDSCLSAPVMASYIVGGMAGIKGYKVTSPKFGLGGLDNIIITAPSTLANKTMSDAVSQQIQWNQAKADEFETQVSQQNQSLYCGSAAGLNYTVFSYFSPMKIKQYLVNQASPCNT